MFITFGEYFDLHWQSTVREILCNIVHSSGCFKPDKLSFEEAVFWSWYACMFAWSSLVIIKFICSGNHNWLSIVRAELRYFCLLCYHQVYFRQISLTSSLLMFSLNNPRFLEQHQSKSLDKYHVSSRSVELVTGKKKQSTND